jgi:hypothetical protein
MEKKRVQVIVRTDDPAVVAMTDKFVVTSYALVDGVAVLGFEDGAEHRIANALGIYTGVTPAG